MIVIGNAYTYNGRKVVVDDGDRVEQVWTVVYSDTGEYAYGVSTSELKSNGEQPRVK